jgi:cytochrome c oxidase subunit III
MSDHAIAAASHAHADHHDDPWSHVPPPSFWPFGVGVGLVLMMCTQSALFAAQKSGGSFSLVWVFGAVAVMLFMLMGWCHQVIKEKPLSHDLTAQQNDLKLFVKMFLVSELMAFSAIFAYFYLNRIGITGVTAPHAPEAPVFDPPANLHVGGLLVAVATFLLLSSSVTCEFAHHAILHGKRGQARLLLLSTIILGIVFLGFQGKEYGMLIEHGFTLSSSNYSSVFYIGTGFHGLHVLTGLVMLFLVWLRLELGHYSPSRHASFIAASWYWHFVDIVWILLFITVYVV